MRKPSANLDSKLTVKQDLVLYVMARTGVRILG